MARITLSLKSIKLAIRDELTFQRQQRDGPNSHDSRPTFVEWLRITYPDIITMLIIGGIAIGFDKMWPPNHRLFPYLDVDGTLLSPTLAHPKIRPTLSAALSGIISVGSPILIFVLSSPLTSFWTTSNSILGLLYANLLGSCIQIMIKTLIGGFRPHFLSVCHPDLSLPGARQGVNGVYHDWTVCTGEPKDIKNALISFPSGHTEAAFASFVFLAVWLNAHLRTWGDRQPRLWQMVVTFAPLLGAVLIAGDLQMTGNHHWYDILMGATIGTGVAVGGYRAMFAAVWGQGSRRALFRGSQVTRAERGIKGRDSSSDREMV
ncbi:hypothetical protein CAC42_4374 [Sphaceloma murrayae]|uniref:Phosphatidic acid phosphatase type 2/haloperoxidase domain-containing protein n=1 Tax=Sphaceloma murrayae TaxID=2082308 RepID=A0A2K1QMC3_9PEZI|nr:hypothetical protein CAC42_4374 [Sphaceloma murrayae]